MPYFLRSASLTNYVEVARSYGLDPYQFLRASRISLTALIDPNQKIPAKTFVQLLEVSAQAAGVEDFGLRMAETRELSNLGPLAFVVREEPTLRKALESMTRYLRLQNEALTTRIEEAGDLVIIRQEVVASLRGSFRQSSELVVGVLYRMLAQFLGATWKPRNVCFMHGAPSSTATSLRVFGMVPLFNQEFDGIMCRAADLEAPLPSYEPAMARQLRQYLDGLLAQSNTTMPDKVRQLVVALLPSGACSIERVAQDMGVDPRTIQRRLLRHGQSYMDIVNQVRSELAMRYVENRERSLTEIAALMGFSSLSAFSRWFTTQFGCSVSKWRQR